MILHVATVAVVAGLMLSLTGCGDSGSSVPTKAEFIRRAEAICKQVPGRQKTERHKFWVQHSLQMSWFREEEKGWIEDIVEFAVLPPIRIEAEELDKLRTPSGDRKEIESIVRELKEAVRKGIRHADTLVKRNSVGPFVKVERLAREYGFKTCANPPL